MDQFYFFGPHQEFLYFLRSLKVVSLLCTAAAAAGEWEILKSLAFDQKASLPASNKLSTSFMADIQLQAASQMLI